MVFDFWRDMPLTENHIKQLHGALLRFSHRDEHHRGGYKMTPNNVEAFDEHGRSVGVIFETATPFDTPLLMEEVVEGAHGAPERGNYGARAADPALPVL